MLKRSVSASEASPVPETELDPRIIRAFKAHPTGFYQEAKKTNKGTPIASQIYWNTDPPTNCPEDLRHNSLFDIAVHEVDIERYDARDNRPPAEKTPTHVLSLEYDSVTRRPDAVQHVGPTPDYELIRSWLGQCDREHMQCRAAVNTEKLASIRLIDVQSQRLVSYIPGVQFLALSYVWGGVQSPKRCGEPGDLPINISDTILQAMTVTKSIGVAYLWVDAVCINQDDIEEKKEQLPLMDYIYEQASATIVALGDNANVGLPGVKGGPLRLPQLVAKFGAVKLLSRAPTLRSQIETSRWSTRGWTYQEGLFSRRCIFFTQHQVYFNCNAMLCSEDSPVPISLPQISKYGRYTFHDSGIHTSDVNYVLEYTLLDSRLRYLARVLGRMGVFAVYLQTYARREVSQDEDAVNAFGALLSRLGREFFPNGFIHGIPRDIFMEGLLWGGYGITRRKKGDFPSWTWAGWKPENGGNISYASMTTSDIHIPVPLQISLGGDQLYNYSTIDAPLSGQGLELQNLWDDYRTGIQNPENLKEVHPESAANALAIDGPIVTLPVAYDTLNQAIRYADLSEVPKVSQWNAPPPLPVSKTASPRDFLILRTIHKQGFGYTPLQFQLILLRWKEEGVATREGFLTLSVEEHVQLFWQFGRVRRGNFWLA